MWQGVMHARSLTTFESEIVMKFLQFLPDVVQVMGTVLPDELLYGRAGIENLLPTIIS